MPKKKREQQEQAAVAAVIPITKPSRRRKTAPVAPADAALKMTDVEALRLGKLDAEVLRLRDQIALLEQSIAISEMKVQEQLKAIQQQLEEYKAQKGAEKHQLIGVFNAKHAEYKREVQAVCAKYGLDPEKFTYDPDTGILRDLRTPPTEGSPPPG